MFGKNKHTYFSLAFNFLPENTLDFQNKFILFPLNELFRSKLLNTSFTPQINYFLNEIAELGVLKKFVYKGTLRISSKLKPNLTHAKLSSKSQTTGTVWASC
jgi:hypothetical protein